MLSKKNILSRITVTFLVAAFVLLSLAACRRMSDDEPSLPTLQDGESAYDTSAALPSPPPLDNADVSMPESNIGYEYEGYAPDLTTEQTVDIIQFGGYGWRVLARQDDRKLLLSDRILFARNYHDSYVDITWADSDIRTYLNNEFLSRFSASDRARIIQVTNQNLDNQWYGTPGGVDTDDYIFLLSIEEIVEFFGDSGDLSNHRRQREVFDGVWAHWVVEADGHTLSDHYNDNRKVSEPYIIPATATAMRREIRMFHWVLRSPGARSTMAANVDDVGRIAVGGSTTREARNVTGGGVRPALWLRLD